MRLRPYRDVARRECRRVGVGRTAMGDAPNVVPSMTTTLKKVAGTTGERIERPLTAVS